MDFEVLTHQNRSHSIFQTLNVLKTVQNKKLQFCTLFHMTEQEHIESRKRVKILLKMFIHVTCSTNFIDPPRFNNDVKFV